jgi:hypothetical protein
VDFLHISLNCKDCDFLYVGNGWFKPTERFLLESQIGWLVFQLSKPCAVLWYFGWWVFRLSTSSLSYFSGHIAIQSVDLRRRNEKKIQCGEGVAIKCWKGVAAI